MKILLATPSVHRQSSYTQKRKKKRNIDIYFDLQFFVQIFFFEERHVLR